MKLRRLLATTSTSALAVIAAFVVGTLLVVLFTDAQPLNVYRVMVHGAFGDVYGVTETLAKASPLLLISLGLMIAFRCRIFVIGAEGQLYMGALAGTWVGAFWLGLPAFLHIPVAAGLAVAAGAAWGAIPGIMRAKLQVNEIITSLMLNYVAIHFVGFLVAGPWRDPAGPEPQSPPIVTQAIWQPLIEQTRLHPGIVIALALALVAYVFLWHTSAGFTVRAVGANPDASRLAGIDVSKHIVAVTAVSGALAGLAGLGEIAGLHYRLLAGVSGGYGYAAIVVALLGKLHPAGLVIASILFAGLVVGADAMQQFANVPAALALVIQGLTILFVICADNIASRFSVEK